jgi:hypothetical protein
MFAFSGHLHIQKLSHPFLDKPKGFTRINNFNPDISFGELFKMMSDEWLLFSAISNYFGQVEMNKCKPFAFRLPPFTACLPSLKLIRDSGRLVHPALPVQAMPA